MRLSTGLEEYGAPSLLGPFWDRARLASKDGFGFLPGHIAETLYRFFRNRSEPEFSKGFPF